MLLLDCGSKNTGTHTRGPALTEGLAMSAVGSRHQDRILERNLPDDLDRAHHLVEVHHASSCLQRRLVDRLHVHIGAIEHGEGGIVPLEREEEVGAAEQNDLGALLPA